MSPKSIEQESFPHENRTFFQSALSATGAATGFDQALIEKDYYCSLVLLALFKIKENPLVFKGGTSLNKIHAGFYRLSEDLDFSISIHPEANRTLRSRAVDPIKDFVAQVPKLIPGLILRRSLKGSNNSSQYNAEFEYPSMVAPFPGTIYFEIGLREELIYGPYRGLAQTLIQNPLTFDPLVAPFNIFCLTKEEAYAEKLRAALSRKTPAIRDLFDIDYAIREAKIFADSKDLHALVRKKLVVPGNGLADLSDDRKNQLRTQLETDLRPVLRPQDYDAFDFDLAWERLEEIAAAVRE